MTPVFPGRQQKRRMVEEEKEGDSAKKVKKEENENVCRISVKNFRKEEEQVEIKEMERITVVVGSKQDERSPDSIFPNQVAVTIAPRKEENCERSSKLLNGSSPTINGGLMLHASPPPQNPSLAKSRMIPSPALKQVCIQTPPFLQPGSKHFLSNKS